MIITLQGNNDLTKIYELTRIVKKQMEFLGSKHSLEKIKCAIENALKTNRAVFFLKLSKDGEIIGFAFGNICSGLETGADYLWINELYVSPDCRKQGIAGEIYEYIEKWAKEVKISYIATITGKTNEISQNFHKKMNYEVSEIIWMDKSLK